MVTKFRILSIGVDWSAPTYFDSSKYVYFYCSSLFLNREYFYIIKRRSSASSMPYHVTNLDIKHTFNYAYKI